MWGEHSEVRGSLTTGKKNPYVIAVYCIYLHVHMPLIPMLTFRLRNINALTLLNITWITLLLLLLLMLNSSIILGIECKICKSNFF